MLKKYPFYIKSTVVLFGLTLLVYALINLRDILVPISFALMLAILLNPVVNWLEQKKIPKIWSITIALVLSIMLIVGIAYFITSQMANFSDQLPVIKKKFGELLAKGQYLAGNKFNINYDKQNQLISDAETKVKPMLGETLGSVVGVIGMFFLLPVYSFLFLFYKTLILNFLYEVFAEKNSQEVNVVLTQTKKAIQSYMVGLLLEALIVAAMNVAALLILGVQYAVLLGVIGAMLNVLPYIGGIIAIALPLIIATITKDGYHTQLGIIIAYVIIQFIDNHYLVPVIVSSKVRINAMISIIIVLLGEAAWGISGMFLSIPFIGVLKILFDHIPEMKPWGKLLGDQIPTRHKGQVWLKNKKPSSVSEKIVDKTEQKKAD